MPKNNDDNLKEDEIYKEDTDHQEESHETYYCNYKNTLWMSDISTDFCKLLEHYQNIDDRLKWVSQLNILCGRRSSYKIKDDSIIKNFIDAFLEQRNCLLSHMNKKKLYIIDNDRKEFERLKSLNKELIYSRIAFCVLIRYV